MFSCLLLLVAPRRLHNQLQAGHGKAYVHTQSDRHCATPSHHKRNEHGTSANAVVAYSKPHLPAVLKEQIEHGSQGKKTYSQLKLFLPPHEVPNIALTMGRHCNRSDKWKWQRLGVCRLRQARNVVAPPNVSARAARSTAALPNSSFVVDYTRRRALPLGTSSQLHHTNNIGCQKPAVSAKRGKGLAAQHEPYLSIEWSFGESRRANRSN
jgi:hypothetical protein